MWFAVRGCGSIVLHKLEFCGICSVSGNNYLNLNVLFWTNQIKFFFRIGPRYFEELLKLKLKMQYLTKSIISQFIWYNKGWCQLISFDVHFCKNLLKLTKMNKIIWIYSTASREWMRVKSKGKYSIRKCSLLRKIVWCIYWFHASWISPQPECDIAGKCW